jgi:hypothetical protein
VLHNLKLKKNLRVAVYGVFLLGIINIAFALARFLTIQLGTDQYFDTFPLVGM